MCNTNINSLGLTKEEMDKFYPEVDLTSIKHDSKSDFYEEKVIKTKNNNRRCRDCGKRLTKTRYFKCLKCCPSELFANTADDELVYFQLPGKEGDDII